MTQEHFVSVKLKADSGAANFAAGQKFTLSLKPGESTEKWGDGSPITLADFKAVLEPENLFELVEEKPRPGTAAPHKPSAVSAGSAVKSPEEKE